MQDNCQMGDGDILEGHGWPSRWPLLQHQLVVAPSICHLSWCVTYCGILVSYNFTSIWLVTSYSLVINQLWCHRCNTSHSDGVWCQIPNQAEGGMLPNFKLERWGWKSWLSKRKSSIKKVSRITTNQTRMQTHFFAKVQHVIVWSSKSQRGPA